MNIGEALAAIENETAAVNYATLIGHNSVRREVMGREQRAPTEEELARMKELVAKGMEEGGQSRSRPFRQRFVHQSDR